MSWIKGNRYLTESEMQNNALEIEAYLDSKGWSLNAIAGLLGNMERESTINPALWQSLDSSNKSGGYGLVQWTPSTNYTNWANSNGYDITDGVAQLKWIDEVTTTVGQWIRTDAYDFSFSTFKTSTESPEYLASAFLKNFERAGVEAEDQRRTAARKWYNFINTGEQPSFEPRLTADGIEGSFYYYSQNPFYLSGFGMPNCTTYAWGRFWEISDTSGNGSNKPTLPTSDAGRWFSQVSGYETGTSPRLGAVICWSDNTGGAGHVAVVEKIADNGDITVSQSGWQDERFFWTNTKSAADEYSYSHYTFQGFIYNPHVNAGGGSDPDEPDVPDEPDEPELPVAPWHPPKKRKGYNFVLFNRQRRMF